MITDSKTALGLYNDMMNRSMAPALRAIGLTGSGGKFELPCRDAWALVGFQKWRPVTTARVSFTVNLSYFDRAEWEQQRAAHEWLGEAPRPNSDYISWGEIQRIGFLMPVRHDHWWNLTLNSDTDRLADEVVDAVMRHGVAWLRSRIEQSA